MNKTQWLDWLEASTDRLQERYREAWNRAPRRINRAAPAEEPKQWSTIHPEIDREAREVVVHLELPEPHTVEAAVRVINSTLSIAVLKRGSDIERASAEDCYRRSIPLPPKVDPNSATHKIHGDELVIRMRPRAPRRRPSDKAANGAELTEGERHASGARQANGAKSGAGLNAAATPARATTTAAGTRGQRRRASGAGKRSRTAETA